MVDTGVRSAKMHHVKNKTVLFIIFTNSFGAELIDWITNFKKKKNYSKTLKRWT